MKEKAFGKEELICLKQPKNNNHEKKKFKKIDF